MERGIAFSSDSDSSCQLNGERLDLFPFEKYLEGRKEVEVGCRGIYNKGREFKRIDFILVGAATGTKAFLNDTGVRDAPFLPGAIGCRR